MFHLWILADPGSISISLADSDIVLSDEEQMHSGQDHDTDDFDDDDLDDFVWFLMVFISVSDIACYLPFMVRLV